MPRGRRTLTIDERNSLERFAIFQGRTLGFGEGRSGSQALTGFVEGFMRGAQLAPEDKAKAIAAEVPNASSRRPRRVKETAQDASLV